MKVLLPKYFWIGGMIDNMEQSFKNAGHDVLTLKFAAESNRTLKNPLNQLKKYNEFSINKKIEEYNARVKKEAKRYRPDLVFFMNSGKLTPDTVQFLNNEVGAKVVCFLPDNPFDSSRSKYTAMNLPWCHDILVCEKEWINNIRNIAPYSKIHKVIVGYNEEHFFQPEWNTISELEKQIFGCDVSFTGAGYADLAEGAYRSIILYHLSQHYNVKIWSNDNWSFRFKYLEGLSDAYQGRRLSLQDLRKLYHLSSINLNMPSPQILSTLQPRVFEVAACAGFQIVDYRSDIFEIFTKEEIPVFYSIPDLKEKIDFYKNNPTVKEKSIQALKSKVMKDHTWSTRINEYFEILDITN